MELIENAWLRLAGFRCSEQKQVPCFLLIPSLPLSSPLPCLLLTAQAVGLHCS